MVNVKYQDGVAEDIKKIAIDVLDEYKDTFQDVVLDDIYFLRSSSDKPRRYFARIMCSNSLFKHFTHLPLVIEVNSDAFNGLDGKMRKIVVYHELLHITAKESGGYSLLQHDIQEFSNVLETFGESVSINLHKSHERYKQIMQEKLEEEKKAKKARKKGD
jgi:predicted metallopeptidase